jgi:predicted Kef-type K+ transport protein
LMWNIIVLPATAVRYGITFSNCLSREMLECRTLLLMVSIHMYVALNNLSNVQAVSRDSAYKTLLQEINQQVVRFGARDYQMKVGLAQGGPLSNPLCNMTLEDMTKNHLSEFSTSDGRSVLWRVADDFLLLTLSENVAKR